MITNEKTPCVLVALFLILGYTNTVLAENEYSLPKRDPGNYQSPINIISTEVKKEAKTHKFSLHFEDKIAAVENLGHTVQLDFKKGSRITAGNISYDFKQMHFHTPAEHLIDGITYPMELHIVAINEELPNMPRYLVIGVLFKMGKENPFIKEFINLIPPKDTLQTVKDNSIKLRDFLSLSELEHHHHYQGSLTTPPYAETAQWFVLRTIFEASPEQIKTINSIEGNNARHIEAENNRRIEDK